MMNVETIVKTLEPLEETWEPSRLRAVTLFPMSQLRILLSLAHGYQNNAPAAPEV